MVEPCGPTALAAPEMFTRGRHECMVLMCGGPVELVSVIRAVSGFQRVSAMFAYPIYVDLIFRDFVYIFFTSFPRVGRADYLRPDYPRPHPRGRGSVSAKPRFKIKFPSRDFRGPIECRIGRRMWFFPPPPSGRFLFLRLPSLPRGPTSTAQLGRSRCAWAVAESSGREGHG